MASEISFTHFHHQKTNSGILSCSSRVPYTARKKNFQQSYTIHFLKIYFYLPFDSSIQIHNVFCSHSNTISRLQLLPGPSTFPSKLCVFFSPCSQINIFGYLIRTALTLQINLGNKDIVITLILFMTMHYFTIHLFSLIAFINVLQHSVCGSFISLVIFILEYFGHYYKQDYFLGHHQYVETLLIFDFVSYCFTRFTYLKKFQEYLQNFLYME